MESQILERVTINPEVCNGKPTIRNMRFTVGQVLELLASGMNAKEILDDYEFLEPDDIKAALLYASLILNPQSVKPIIAA